MFLVWHALGCWGKHEFLFFRAIQRKKSVEKNNAIQNYHLKKKETIVRFQPRCKGEKVSTLRGQNKIICSRVENLISSAKYLQRRMSNDFSMEHLLWEVLSCYECRKLRLEHSQRGRKVERSIRSWKKLPVLTACFSYYKANVFFF